PAPSAPPAPLHPSPPTDTWCCPPEPPPPNLVHRFAPQRDRSPLVVEDLHLGRSSRHPRELRRLPRIHLSGVCGKRTASPRRRYDTPVVSGLVRSDQYRGNAARREPGRRPHCS